MSNNNSASHAAALAAFKGLGNKKDESTAPTSRVPSRTSTMTSIKPPQHTQKPQLHLSTGKSYSTSTVPKVKKSPVTPTLTAIHTPTGQGRIHHPPTRTASQSSHLPQQKPSQEPPSKLSIVTKPSKETVTSPDAGAGAAAAVKALSLETPPKSSKSNRNSYNSIDSDIISPLAVKPNGDYFSMPRSNTLTTKNTITNDPKLSPETSRGIKNSPGSVRRLHSNTQPQDMLSQVRNSIISKTKTSSAVELTEKNLAAINEIRQSINLKRVSTHNTSSNLMLPYHEDDDDADDDRRRSVPSFVSQSSGDLSAPTGRMIYDKEIFHNSYSSLGSTLLEADSYNGHSPTTPVIVLNNTSEKQEKKRPSQILGSKIRKTKDNIKSITPNQKRKSKLKNNTENADPSNNYDNNDDDDDDDDDDNDNADGSDYEDECDDDDDDDDEDDIQVNKSRNISPIAIPPSQNAYARSLGANTGSMESLRHSSNPSLSAYASGEERVGTKAGISLSDLNNAKAKPKRKPPPGVFRSESNEADADNLYISDESNSLKPMNRSKKNSGSGSSVNSTYESNFATDHPTFGIRDHTTNELTSNTSGSMVNLSGPADSYYTDGEISEMEKLRVNSTRSGSGGAIGKFPQFPDIDHKSNARKHTEHKHNIFKKKYKIKGVDSTVNLLELDDSDSHEASADPLSRSNVNLSAPSRSGTPGISHLQQPVQLKTTMRKTNKRKEKKMAFNEDKPWKNHNELRYVTEQERKRYEGVWVSNKGLYMNFVVTRLMGVDYTKQPQDEEKFGLTEEEASTKAARLSSKATTNLEGATIADYQKLHDLVNIDINQLIHGVVVKRIWKRSRLSNETLEAIWNLVDFRQDGSLNKAEFLVGMWLVDQCLYGRKLPKKVDDVVWESLGNIGINVQIKKKGRR